MAGHPKRLEFSNQKKELTIVDILHIYWVQTFCLGGIDIRYRGPRKLLSDFSLDYMAQRLPPCLFFYCGQSNIVNMKRVKSCRRVGKRIKLLLIGNKSIYVSRLRVSFFLALLAIYPDITWVEDI